MNNTIIAQSLARIEPSEPAQERMFEQILERASANDSRARTRKFVKRLAPIAACMAIAITAVIGYQANWFRGETPADPAGTGVFVPAMKLPENANNANALRIGAFVYQGRIYVKQTWKTIDEIVEMPDIENLVGERIGFAKGNIGDEQSTQDDYAVEFAGSAYGDVYTVNGYDPSFRLCMRQNYIDDGNYFERVEFYENLNGIHLMTGADLFGDRLMLRGNWTQAKFQKHDDWNWGRNILNDLTGVSDSDINAFIDELYSGNFEDAYDEIGDIDNFYRPEEKRRHLYFYMNDNTVIELNLFEGGYVGYRSFALPGWYYVKMPGEAFDKMFAAAE
jgi:hypothetical protein